jgi:hypothetical protein
MLDFFETVTMAYEQFEAIPTGRIKELFRMGSKLSSIVGQISHD